MKIRPPFFPPIGTAILVLIVINLGIEATLSAADAGLIGSTRWRALAYQNGAFWAGLLHGWQPNYPAQPWLMFLSYSLLHSGPVHVVGNMLVLWGMGKILQLRLHFSTPWFLTVYFLSGLGGGIGFGLLSQSPQPMVGASGALFGLVGAWQYWRWSRRRRAGRSLWPVWETLAGLVLLNLVFWLLMNGYLAWQTHLGGFIAGWAGAMGLDRLPARRRSRP